MGMSYRILWQPDDVADIMAAAIVAHVREQLHLDVVPQSECVPAFACHTTRKCHTHDPTHCRHGLPYFADGFDWRTYKTSAGCCFGIYLDYADDACPCGMDFVLRDGLCLCCRYC